MVPKTISGDSFALMALISQSHTVPKPNKSLIQGIVGLAQTLVHVFQENDGALC